jgi:hypothetical protein
MLRCDPDGLVEIETLRVLSDLTGFPDTSLTLQLRLVDDLHIASDDLTFVFAPALEKRFKVKIPTMEWRNVFTGGHAVELLRTHLERRRT